MHQCVCCGVWVNLNVPGSVFCPGCLSRCTPPPVPLLLELGSADRPVESPVETPVETNITLPLRFGPPSAPENNESDATSLPAILDSPAWPEQQSGADVVFEWGTRPLFPTTADWEWQGVPSRLAAFGQWYELHRAVALVLLAVGLLGVANILTAGTVLYPTLSPNRTYGHLYREGYGIFPTLSVVAHIAAALAWLVATYQGMRVASPKGFPAIRVACQAATVGCLGFVLVGLLLLPGARADTSSTNIKAMFLAPAVFYALSAFFHLLFLSTLSEHLAEPRLARQFLRYHKLGGFLWLAPGLSLWLKYLAKGGEMPPSLAKKAATVALLSLSLWFHFRLLYLLRQLQRVISESRQSTIDAEAFDREDDIDISSPVFRGTD